MNNWLKWNWVDWALIALVTVGVVSMLPVFRGWPMAAQDAGFLALLLALVWCPFLGWWRFAVLRHEGEWPSWRVWTSLGSCIALSAAVAVPFLIVMPFFFVRSRWNFLNAWFIMAVAAFILGCVSEKRVRFPLILGGFGIVSLVVLIPKGFL